MIFEFTLKIKLTGVAVIVLELFSYVKFIVEIIDSITCSDSIEFDSVWQD
jgi:hypothetical protein